MGAQFFARTKLPNCRQNEFSLRISWSYRIRQVAHRVAQSKIAKENNWQRGFFSLHFASLYLL